MLLQTFSNVNLKEIQYKVGGWINAVASSKYSKDENKMLKRDAAVTELL